MPPRPVRDPERKRKGKRLLKREPKLFRYGRQYGRADPYYALLNNIQNQAHIGQVNGLIREVRQAKEFAARARQEAIDEIYAPVRPMEVDEHAPPSRADVHTAPMRRGATRAAHTQTPPPGRSSKNFNAEPTAPVSTRSRAPTETTQGKGKGLANPDRFTNLNGPGPSTRPQRQGVGMSTQTEKPKTRGQKTQVQPKTRTVGVGPDHHPSSQGWDPALVNDTFAFTTEAGQTPAQRRDTRRMFHPRVFNPSLPLPTPGSSTPVIPNFLSGNPVDTWMDYHPITRDNKSPRIQPTFERPRGPAMGQDSRFYPFPPRVPFGRTIMNDID